MWDGIEYSKAWANGAPPDPVLNRRVDGLSGIGALPHASGKFGSAFAARVGDRCEDLVFVSRLPAILVGSEAVWQQAGTSGDVTEVLLALGFLFCTLVWTAADRILLHPAALFSQSAHVFSRKGGSTTMQADHTQKLADLERTINRLSVRRFAKDQGLADEFEDDTIGCGSEAADIFVDLAGLRRHFHVNMAKDFTVRWSWTLLESRVDGDTGWFFASGSALIGRNGSETAYPFRMSGVLSWRDNAWHWRLLHASEPVG